MLYVPDGSGKNAGIIGRVSAAKRHCAVMPQQNIDSFLCDAGGLR